MGIPAVAVTFKPTAKGVYHQAQVDGFSLLAIIPDGAVSPRFVSASFLDAAKANKISNVISSPNIVPTKDAAGAAIRDADGLPVLCLMGHAQAARTEVLI